MGEPLNVASPAAQPVWSVASNDVARHPAGPLIVRVSDVGELSALAEVPLERVVWFEVPPALAGAPWPAGAPLDVVVEDPVREAAALYALTQVHDGRAVRVTIPGQPGMARCARVAVALQLPVRLMVVQPTEPVVAELEQLLDVYLHDAPASAPVEPLHAALAWHLCGDAPGPWVALELDPDWFRRAGPAEPSADPLRAPEPGFVSRRLAHLVANGAECGGCRFASWCQGFFKWPDPAYSCAGVTRLLARVSESALQIGRDLEEAQALEP